MSDPFARKVGRVGRWMCSGVEEVEVAREVVASEASPRVEACPHIGGAAERALPACCNEDVVELGSHARRRRLQPRSAGSLGRIDMMKRMDGWMDGWIASGRQCRFMNDEYARNAMLP